MISVSSFPVTGSVHRSASVVCSPVRMSLHVATVVAVLVLVVVGSGIVTTVFGVQSSQTVVLVVGEDVDVVAGAIVVVARTVVEGDDVEVGTEVVLVGDVLVVVPGSVVVLVVVGI